MLGNLGDRHSLGESLKTFKDTYMGSQGKVSTLLIDIFSQRGLLKMVPRDYLNTLNFT